MGESSNIRDFELMLQKNSSKKPSNLYNTTEIKNKQPLQPQDVLDCVYSQIKQIQLADGRNSKTGKDLNKDRKTNFLAINKLPLYSEVPKQVASRFDTQCVSDTQLLSVIEDAEAHFDTHKGITQEFETTFKQPNVNTHRSNADTLPHNHTRDRNSSSDTNRNKTDNKDAMVTQIDIALGQDIFDSRNIDSLKVMCGKVLEENSSVAELFESCKDREAQKIELHDRNWDTQDIEKESVNDEETIDNGLDKEADYTIMLNASMTTDNIKERSVSPVFKIKAKPKLPLVVPLEDFEKFEMLAQSIVSTTEDLEICKNLINSQIMGGELCLNTENIVFDENCEVSPISEMSAEIFDDEELKNEYVPNLDKVESGDKGSDSLKDEILFSSDEESDYKHREFQDIPLTVALETSFYDHSNVLEETMFVGFQTASNKSIQICTDSFQKAKSLLHENEDIGKEYSLSELVGICDEKNQMSSLKVQENVNPEIEVTKVIRCSNKKPLEKDFKSACHKNIDTSAKATYKGNICMDEDFDEKDLQQSKLKSSDENPTKHSSSDLKSYIDDKIYDDLLIQEFENIEMSLEEKETSDIQAENHFEGFKTASNRKIAISDVAMAKIKNIFQDINLGVIKENPDELDLEDKTISDNLPRPAKTNTNRNEINSETTLVGFKTASNKNINITAQAFAKGKNIFHDIDAEIDKNNDDVKDITQSIKDFNQPSTSKAAFLGFKTASNKHIKISDAAITKCKNIFDDIDKDPNINDEVEMPLFKEFKTTSNKASAFEQALPSRNLFQENYKADDPMMTKKIKGFCGFKTASNKSVTFSEESLAKSKKLFSELDAEKKANDNQLFDTENKNASRAFIGLQTASNNPVYAIKDSMNKSRKLFQNDGSDKSNDIQTDSKIKDAIDETLDQRKLEEAGQDVSKNMFVGFKTASNKNLNVSKDALAKCRKIFDDLDDIPIDAESKETSKATFEFHKTSYKKEISDTIEKTKNVFKDVEIEENEPKTFMGFQTGSKKKVIVSKEAIEKTKCLFDDIGHRNNEPKLFMGFQTASKKKVAVSDEAMAKSKQLFEGIDKNTEYNRPGKDTIDGGMTDKSNVKEDVKKMLSFQTANNKNSNVSKAALEKSKKLLEEDLIIPKKDEVQSKTNSDIINIDGIINTQVLQNFEESLCTEDFDKTPRNKRSGSPILSCPKAKKRKIFKTPYKGEKDERVIDSKIIKESKCNTDPTVIKFNENYKKNKIYTLEDLKNFEDDKIKTINTYISDVNLENILNFEFQAEQNDVTKTQMSIEALKTIFLNAINKNLVPDGWINNHLKLILWKLLSYEIKYPNLGTVCTVNNVIDQLKYRYDKELYNAERPALRKILERDDVSTKTMVLCVAGIFVDGVSVSSVASTENIELLLTDGWYFVKATIDRMMAKLVYDRRIVVGCKIVTNGAELMNCEQGMSPWEDTSAVRLKLSGNSTRLAKWHSRLGYTPGAILSHLSSVRIDGGKVSRVRVYVARVYPLLYVEKFEDGSTVTRSERLEHLHQIKLENDRELMMERIYEEVQKELSDQFQESQDSEGFMETGKRKSIDSGSQIAKMMKRSKDPMEFRAQLTLSQVKLLQDHTSKYREKVIQNIQNKIQEKITNRNVVTLARGRIADIKKDGNTVTVTKGMLSIWKPNDAILDIFKEGSWVEVMNVVPTSMRCSEIQITAGRQSVFRPTKYKNDSKHLQSLQRKCYKISDVSQNPAMSTDYNEIDTVGIVFLIDPTNREFDSSRNFQNVYISDADKNMICINFWGGMKKFGFENIFDTGQIVSCANLQKRAGNTGKNIPQFRVTEFSFFTKTPKNVQAREMIEDLNKKLFGLDRRKFCDDCVAIKSNYTAIRCFNNENESPYRMNGSDYSFARNKMFIDTPVNQKKHSEDLNLNLSGLDFESTFKQDTQELSPKTLLRKKRVNEKIARLKMYGEPPPLSPISIINKSMKAANSYKCPLLPKNTVSPTVLPENSVASINQNLPINVTMIRKFPEESPKALPRESDGNSPVISMKRSYVKAVPTKLNFTESAAISENKVDSVDHFAEEFDGSPPLSLD